MKVNTEELLRQSDALQKTMWKMDALRSEVLRISRWLETEAVGEKFGPALRELLTSMQDQQTDLKCLGDVLEQSAQLYDQYERQIVEESQETWVSPVISGYRIFPILAGPDQEQPPHTPVLDWSVWDP